MNYPTTLWTLSQKWKVSHNAVLKWREGQDPVPTINGNKCDVMTGEVADWLREHRERVTALRSDPARQRVWKWVEEHS